MSHLSNKRPRRWYQFSLRMFLVVSVLFGVTSIWLAKNYHEYRGEQKILKDAMGRVVKNHQMVVTIDGKTNWAGMTLL